MHAPVLVVAFGGRIFGLDPATGQRRWTHEMRTTGQTHVVRLAVDGDHLFAAIYRDLLCLEVATGAVRWQVDAGLACDTLLVAGGRVHAAGGGTVRTYAAADGAPLWKDGFSGMGEGEVALALGGAVAQADRD